MFKGKEIGKMELKIRKARMEIREKYFKFSLVVRFFKVRKFVIRKGVNGNTKKLFVD